MPNHLAVSPALFLDSPWGHFQVVGPDGNEIEVQPSGSTGAGHWTVTIRDHDGGSIFAPHTRGILIGVY